MDYFKPAQVTLVSKLKAAFGESVLDFTLHVVATQNKNPSEKQNPQILSTFTQVLRFQSFNAFWGLLQFKRSNKILSFIISR